MWSPLSLFKTKPKKTDKNYKDTTEVEKNAELIKGIDLKIDSSVQEICEVYNKSAGSTRSALYILLIINILSLMSVINTHRDNWTVSRINAKQKTIDSDQQEEIILKENYKDSKDKVRPSDKKKLTYKLDSIKHKYRLDSIKNSDDINRYVNERNNLIRNRIENSQTVKVPILGNSFDINNLAIMSGISFIILLIVVRFTLTREKNNLRIALNSITERYDYTIEDDLKPEIIKKFKKQISEEVDIVEAFNFKRRRYHYNYLSMNEIFNVPELDISNNILQKKPTGKIAISYMYSFVFMTYLVVFINDLTTIDQGYKVSHWQTIALCSISYICLNFIARICNNCNEQKTFINGLFNSFLRDKYTYDKAKNLKDELADEIGNGEGLNTVGDIFKIIFYIFFYSIYFITKKMIYDLCILLFSKNKVVK